MSEISPATGKLLALSMLKGVGPTTLRKMAGIANFGTATPESLSYQFPAASAVLRDVQSWARALEGAEKQAEEAERRNARILSPLDADYPALLAATKDDPFLLFIRGTLALEPAKSVAVIGTREPTKHGGLIAQRITQYLAEKGWSVVSGLAKGCDAVAHQAAVDSDGHTVAVLAHGLHTVSPKGNARLAEDILDKGGALISEYRFGVEPRPEFFVKRDRTQAGLAQGVVMIQSDLKGGSLHASRAALDYGRWLAAPYPTDLDRINVEPKVQANLLLADGSEQERMELLRCPASALKRVIILRGREDYKDMIANNTAPETTLPPTQGGLI
ncbi:DNA-processing protein DprA [uncultured Xanthomonas sp.]|uniref:DNA-processing protein DprA n=1 Tax=uncultured Xanthomonas sp. TaxID=152831 RepID=UPI0025D7795C|nr:DNA-processing protein DprA [uncultured Xanthomonas sp.]